MTIAEVQDIVRSVITHYGLGASLGRVTSTGREWQVEIIDASRVKMVVTIPTDTAQGVRRAILGAFHMEG
jgi:predicted SprT family Zn-dependent metalloprotease